MLKVNFEERVKLIPLDMNALHDETENGMGELVQAMSGGTGSVLFKDAFNPAVDVLGNITISIPEQWFGIAGVVGKIPAQVAPLGPDIAPINFRIFFVNRRGDVLGNRDQYQIVGGVISVVTNSIVVRKSLSPRIEVTSAAFPAVPAPPILAPGDLGYVEYASVSWDGFTLSSTHNVAAIYTFPGYASGVGLHAGSHLSTGLDGIQLAALGGPMGSVEGLMPEGSFQVLKESIRDVLVNPACPYFTATIVGDNTFGAPTLAKKIDFRVRHDSSFLVKDVSGVKFLGLNFQTGPYAGDSGRPSQSNHRHSPSETPIALEQAHVTATSGMLGTVVSVPNFPGITRIFSVQVFWAPPGIVSPNYPLFECGWFQSPYGRIGVKGIIVADDEVKIEIGGYAFIELTADALAMAKVACPGGWENAGSEAYPAAGELYVKIVGSR